MIDWSKLKSAEARQAEAGQAVREAGNAEARKYLAETDWYVTRHLETGAPIPQEVTQARAEARQRVI